MNVSLLTANVWIKCGIIMARLRIISGFDRGGVFSLGEGGEVIVGREDCDVVLGDEVVSRRHFRIFFEWGHFFAADCGSSNGTFVNGVKIEGAQCLQDEDQIRCGGTVLLFESAEHVGAEKSAGDAEAGGETMVGLAAGELVSKEAAKRQRRVGQAGLKALDISHGIKNLLQTMASGREVVELALEIGDIERAKRGWGILDRNLDQIDRLVVNLLKFSKGSELQLSACELNELVESIVAGVRGAAQEKGVAIGLEVDEGIGTVEIDSGQMGDVVLNLLLNAVDALEGEEGRIDVSTERAGGEVVIRVSDDGCGIADLGAIFEPFHSTKARTGTGLGLAIVKRVVEQHGGTVEVESSVGKGAKFVVKLPVRG
jgi:signal transduction histidine kinase